MPVGAGRNQGWMSGSPKPWPQKMFGFQIHVVRWNLDIFSPKRCARGAFGFSFPCSYWLVRGPSWAVRRLDAWLFTFDGSRTRPTFRIREPKKLTIALKLPGLTNFPFTRSSLTMPGKAAKITITERQKEILQTFSRSVTAPSRLRQRASIIVLAFDGLLNEDIAARVGLTHRQVGRWRRRWANAWNQLIDIECCESRAALRRAIEAILSDEPRPGAPGKFTPEQVVQILAVACEPPEKSGRPITHWTTLELTDEVIKRGIVDSISPAQVARYLREAALQPHKSRYWLNTTEKDPVQFQKQVEAVCDCYLEAPELAKNHNTHTVS